MKLLLEKKVMTFPIQLTAIEALNFYRHESSKHEFLMVVAAGWREEPELGEEDWFEELGPDEFDEDFLNNFDGATIQLWMR
jgi:hypothetical protein